MTAFLDEGSSTSRWVDWPCAIIMTVLLAVIGQRTWSRWSLGSRRRTSLAATLTVLYTAWWSTIVVATVLNPRLDVDPKRLLFAAFFFVDAHVFVGSAVGFSFLVAILIVLGRVIRRSPRVGADTEMFTNNVDVHRPVFTNQIVDFLACSAPGLILLPRAALDLVARQHVERSTVDQNGNVVELIGPLVPTFLWTAVTAISLGFLIVVATVHVVRSFVTNKIVWPTFKVGFVSLIALAFVVRLGTLLTIAPIRTDGGDPLFYHSTANFLATGHGFPEPLNFIAFQNWKASALHGPLYPFVLSFVSRLGGTTYFDHKIFSLLIGSAVVAMVGLVAREVAPTRHARRIALIAMFLAAVYPNLWIVDGVMFPEGLMALCTTAVVYTAYRWKSAPRWRWAAAMGVLVGLAALARGEGLLLSVLLIVPWIFLHRAVTLRTRIKHIALAALTCLIVMAPWTIRNARSFEVFVPLSTNGNELFVYANCDSVYSGKFIGFWMYACQEDLRTQGIDAVGDEAEKSIFWRKQGFDYAKEHRSELPKVVAARVARQWDLFRPWQNTEFAPIEGRDKNAARAGLFMYYGLAALSVYGAVLIRRRRAGLLPLGALFVNVTLTAMYAYGTTRFRVPAEPALCVLAAVGVYPLIQRIARRYRSTDPPPKDDEYNNEHEHDYNKPVIPFVHGGSITWRRLFRRSAAADWTSFAIVAAAIGAALPALYRSVGSSMEEGFMLVFPERVIAGAVANVDFLHLYGPGSLHVLSVWFRAFGTTLTSERTFGLLQHLLVVFGLLILTRPWGRKLSTLVALVSIVFVFTPIGLQALAWSGGVGIALWSVIFGIRGWHRQQRQLDATWTWTIAGMLAGLALTFRPDLVLALVLVFGWVLRRQTKALLLRFAFGAVVGLTSVWVHFWQAGPSAFVRGVLLDPVVHLRPGRELPRPPSWSYLQGALQVISEKFAPWWGVPHLSAPQQLFLWFFLLPVIAVALAVLARQLRRRSTSPTSSQRATTLFAASLFSIGLLPQALQRPDSAHLLWVSCISWPLLIVALADLIRLRAPRVHPVPRTTVALAATIALIAIVAPFYTLRTYTDLVWRSLTGKTEVLQVTRGERFFYLGDTRPYLAATEVVAELDALSKPGERLLVGPVDLRNTSYSDAFFYHLFPDLTPATFFIEMDPGLADIEGSRLADDVASADWLILTRFWSGWIEPNASTVFGPDAPNRIVEENFCLQNSYQHDLVRLYRKCSGGDGIGPYDAPYEPQYDYAVEVRVPVPARPDGTCTPTCDGRYNPEFDGIDTSVLVLNPSADDATPQLEDDASP